MTIEEELQRVVDDYEDLKVKHWELKKGINNKGIHLQIEILQDRLIIQREKHEEAVAGMKEKARKQQEEIEKLHQRIKTADDDDEIIVLPTNHKKLKVGQYVTMKKHEKLQKQIVELTEKLNKYENIQTIQE